jgi:hypothetical protein
VGKMDLEFKRPLSAAHMCPTKVRFNALYEFKFKWDEWTALQSEHAVRASEGYTRTIENRYSLALNLGFHTATRKVF